MSFMNALQLASAAALAAAMAFSSPAQAATVYSYIGPLFTNTSDATPPDGAYDTSMRITGSFSVASPLTPGNHVFTPPRAFRFSMGATRGQMRMPIPLLLLISWLMLAGTFFSGSLYFLGGKQTP
jgi:type IV secretory pathway protease TraF